MTQPPSLICSQSVFDCTAGGEARRAKVRLAESRRGEKQKSTGDRDSASRREGVFIFVRRVSCLIVFSFWQLLQFGPGNFRLRRFWVFSGQVIK